ncbi:MAG: hypothetical protein DK306_001572 [Chloroflexi bacterium]|nr:MAG: hypothetical protein DK306_001572 [Chloroflexota bacterium]
MPWPAPAERRSPGQLARIFQRFGAREAPQLSARLYAALCPAIAADDDLLAVAASASPTQPPPNLLFGAVHYLLLDGRHDPLSAFYPDLAPTGSAADPLHAFPHFRDFVLRNRTQIETLIAGRRVQTNVIQRCTCLLPAFAHVADAAPEHALALLEIGPSAGLNLAWDRYGYRYHGATDARWGDPSAPVQLDAELRGAVDLPPLPANLPVAWRAGLELHPVDITNDDQVRWLRALIWPEHVERHQRLAAAIAVARQRPPRIVPGDATTDLASLLTEAPIDAALCVFATHALYQVPDECRQRIDAALQNAAQLRPVWFLSMEGTGPDYSQLFLHRCASGDHTITHLADCNAHGRWIEWRAGRPILPS